MAKPSKWLSVIHKTKYPPTQYLYDFDGMQARTANSKTEVIWCRTYSKAELKRYFNFNKQSANYVGFPISSLKKVPL